MVRRFVAMVLSAALAAGPGGLAMAQAPAAPSPYDAVDPFIGTAGKGHTFPGAVAPVRHGPAEPRHRLSAVPPGL
jgi:putative alpha-1,2-mannosidase